MKGLLIEFNLNTGKRAGNINPRDKNLFCYGHQNLDVTPALEIRCIRDNRDLSQYEGIQGVTVLNNDNEIDDAIDEFIVSEEEDFIIESETIFKIHLEQRGINLDDIPGDSVKEILKNLKQQGIKGLKSTKKIHKKTKDIKL